MNVSAWLSDLDDAACVVIPASVTESQLLTSVGDIEDLFRLNPYLEIIRWDALSHDKFAVCWLNNSNSESFLVDTQLSITRSDNTLTLRYGNGCKLQTRIVIDSDTNGSTLTIIDEYRLQDNAHDQVTEIDKSLRAWGRSIQRHVLLMRCWPLYTTPGRRLVKSWLRMTPMARRITTSLLIISAVEVIALLVIGVVLLVAQV